LNELFSKSNFRAVKSSPERRHLSRIPVWLKPDQAVIYFVTVCCRDRRRLFENAKAIRITLESLVQAAVKADWAVPQACFMPDHVHLMALPRVDRDQSLSSFIQRWKSSSKQRLHRHGFSGEIWQREFFDHLLRSGESLTEKWRYVEMNPVRAGLVETPAAYPHLGSPDDIMKRINSK